MGALARRRVMAAALTTFLAVGVAPTIPAAAAAAAEPAAVTVPAVGPIDPNTGYPFWYQDATGEKYELCFDRATPANGLCLAAPEQAARPWVDEIPAESNLAADPETFWFDATATITEGGADALFVAAKEATFGGADEAPRAGDQIAFGRVRIRVSNLVAGKTYTVTHPYGTETLVAEDDGTGVGEINYTEDLGCLDVPCDFGKANDSAVTSYLRWAGDAPQGYVGDPNVPHRVVGSPFGTNFFRVEGLNAGGAGVNMVETDLFSVQGKLWAPTGPMLGLVATGNTVDFGRVPVAATDPTTQAVTETVTLTNAGGQDDPLVNEPLTLNRLGVSGADAAQFALSDDTCSDASLLPGETCTVDVTFTPPATAGTADAQLDVPSNGKDSDGGQRILLTARTSDGTDPRDQRATGPLSLEHGFPLWYQDENGLQLALCDDPADTMCLPPARVYPNGMTFPTNFEDELFWWGAEAHTETNGGHDAELVMAQEAAFANELPAYGDQIAFGRIRVRVGGLTPGATYKVTTPYGVREFVAEDDEDRSINFTEDIGCLETPCDFTKVNGSSVGPFLQRTGTTPDSDYVGDPNVDGPVTGSPTGENVFRVEGPGIYAPEGDDSEAPPPADGCPTVPGPDADCVEISDFSISGKVWRTPEHGLLALDAPSSTVGLGVAAPGGSGAAQTVTLDNVGLGEVAPGSISLQHGTDVQIVDNGCSVPVARGAGCSVVVQLSPAATTAGPVEDFLQIADISSEAGNQPGTIYLRGRANGAGAGLAAPSRPTLHPADDTGVSPHDGITRANGLTVEGAAMTGRPVTVQVAGRSQTVTPVAGVWSADLPSLGEGPHTVTVAYADGSPGRSGTVTVDRAAPGRPAAPGLSPGSNTGTNGDTVTADLTPTVTGTAPADARLVQVLVDGRVVGTATVAADGSWRYTLPSLGRGSARVTVVAVDAADNAGPASAALNVRVDVRAPVVTSPRLAPVVLGAQVGGRVLAQVAWSSQEGATFQLQVSRNGGAFRNVSLPRPEATSVETRLVIGDRYRFRVRATDAAGNTTAWATTSRLRARVAQEDAGAVRLAGGWDQRRNRRALGRELTVADRRGDRATLVTRARAVSVVASTGPNRGRAAVLLNGRRVDSVDLYSPRVRNRRPVATVDGLSPNRTSRVQVRVLNRKRPASRGTRVFVDGFVVVR